MQVKLASDGSTVMGCGGSTAKTPEELAYEAQQARFAQANAEVAKKEADDEDRQKKREAKRKQDGIDGVVTVVESPKERRKSRAERLADKQADRVERQKDEPEDVKKPKRRKSKAVIARPQMTKPGGLAQAEAEEREAAERSAYEKAAAERAENEAKIVADAKAAEEARAAAAKKAADDKAAADAKVAAEAKAASDRVSAEEAELIAKHSAGLPVGWKVSWPTAPTPRLEFDLLPFCDTCRWYPPNRDLDRQRASLPQP